MKRWLWSLLGGLAVAGILLGGCKNYQKFWDEYDDKHLVCKTSAPDSLTGETRTKCPTP